MVVPVLVNTTMIHHDIDAEDDDSSGLLPGYAMCSSLMLYLHKGPRY